MASRIYSLMLSCKEAGVDPESYLEDVLGRVSSTADKDIAELRCPLDSLLSNWAYMVKTTLAWNMTRWSGEATTPANDETGGFAGPTWAAIQSTVALLPKLTSNTSEQCVV